MSLTAFDIRRKNLRRLIVEKYEDNNAAFARAAEVHPNQVNLMLTENLDHRRNLGETLARTMEQTLGLQPGYFDDPHGTSDASEAVRIQVLPVPPDMAHIFQLDDALAEVSYYRRSLGMLKGRITDPQNLTIWRVATRDMVGVLKFDQLVLVDLGVIGFSNDGVYILQRGGEVLLRKVEKKLTGGWTIAHARDAEVIKVESMKGIRSMGRVVATATDITLL